jgi:hypothetical protein
MHSAAGMHTRTLVKVCVRIFVPLATYRFEPIVLPPWRPQDLFGQNIPLQSMRGYSINLIGCRGPVPDIAIVDEGSGAMRFQMLPLGGGTIRIVGFGEFIPSCDPTPTPAERYASIRFVHRTKCFTNRLCVFKYCY